LVSGLTRTVAQDAVDAALRAAELDPNNATVHETLARFDLASGVPLRAIEEIRTAQRLRPKRPGLRLLEGDILRAVGDKAGSLAAYRAEVALHAGTDSVWLAAQEKVTAAAIEAGDHDTALREAQTLVSKAPTDPTGRRLLEAARTMRTY
jgi:Flp pilus assembly protein TadD